MFEFQLYCDDSGTDANTPVAVAACYVSSKTQWDHFARNWDEVREREGFDVFHMCEFMAKPEAGHKPYCDWENAKKDRVYQKLASIIDTRIGVVLRLLCRKLRLIDTFSRNLKMGVLLIITPGQ
jgi:hypothetical protein